MLGFVKTYGLILVFALPCWSNKLPTYFPKCYVDDPKLNECLLKAFNGMRGYARNGIKEIGLPALNKIITPLIIKQESSMANFTVVCTDFTVQGLDSYDIKDIRYNPETLTIRVQVEFEFLEISAHHSIGGHLIYIPINGTGFTRYNGGPTKAIFKIKGELSRSNGVDYYDTKDISVDLELYNGHFLIEGFYNNNKELNSLTTQMLNNNSKMAIKAVNPAVEKIVETAIRRFMKRLTKYFSYNDILPHSQ